MINQNQVDIMKISDAICIYTKDWEAAQMLSGQEREKKLHEMEPFRLAICAKIQEQERV